jgi:tetratricopeptide (TPR) repeat protein
MVAHEALAVTQLTRPNTNVNLRLRTWRINMRKHLGALVAAITFIVALLGAGSPSRGEVTQRPNASLSYPPADWFDQTYHSGEGRKPDEIRDAIEQQVKRVKKSPADPKEYAHLGMLQEDLALSLNDKEYLREALESYRKANAIGLKSGLSLYTFKIAQLLVRLNDRELADEIFSPMLGREWRDRGQKYVMLVDYANVLAALGEEDRVDDLFREAIATFPEKNLGAYNYYSLWLMSKGRDREALQLLNKVPEATRTWFRFPSVLRNRIIDRLKLKIKRDKLDDEGDASHGTQAGIQRIFDLSYVHAANSSNDDCRDPGNPPRCISYGGSCYSTFSINLAEVMFNEARTERWGAVALVGWTIRNRAYQGVSCDSYVGGVNYSCPLPCSELGLCDLSRRYCCVIHGNTMTPGTSQFQFDDTHVPLSSLVGEGYMAEALRLIKGKLVDMSTLYTAPGVGGCLFSCDNPHCIDGVDYTTPSPNGPMEFMGYNYCAPNWAVGCKRYVKNVCGNTWSNVPANLDCRTGGYSGDNFFWNRVN